MTSFMEFMHFSFLQGHTRAVNWHDVDGFTWMKKSYIHKFGLDELFPSTKPKLVRKHPKFVVDAKCRPVVVGQNEDSMSLLVIHQQKFRALKVIDPSYYNCNYNYVLNSKKRIVYDRIFCLHNSCTNVLHKNRWTYIKLEPHTVHHDSSSLR